MEVFLIPGVDTIALTSSFFSFQQMENVLSSEWKKLEPRNGKLAVFVLKVPKNSKRPRLTLSQTPNYLWHLTVEVSLSAWLTDSNLVLANLVECRIHLKALEEYILKKSGFEIDVPRSRVARVDFAIHISVGEQNKPRIIRNLAFLQLTRFEVHLINAETVYFQNKAKNYVIVIYDKFAEIIKKQPQTPGIENFRDYIRLEVRIRTAHIRRVADKLKLPNRTAEMFLTHEVAEHVIKEAKEKIHLELFLIENEDWIAQTYSKLSSTDALKMVGFIPSLRRFGRELYCGDQHKINLRTFQRYIKKCLGAGINPYE